MQCPNSPNGLHKTFPVMSSLKPCKAFMEIESTEGGEYEADFCEHCKCLFVSENLSPKNNAPT